MYLACVRFVKQASPSNEYVCHPWPSLLQQAKGVSIRFLWSADCSLTLERSCAHLSNAYDRPSALALTALLSQERPCVLSDAPDVLHR